MNRLAIALSAVLPLLASLPAQGQKLEPGKWTGTVTPPNQQEAQEVTYDVAMKGDTIAITVNAGEHGSFPFNEVKLNEKTLTFWFMPGPRVECTLTRADEGLYRGTCLDADGGTATMVMIPPRKG